MKQVYILMAVAMLLTACGGGKKTMSETEKPVGPQFSADSAYTFCQQQCDFGPRTMNSEAHEQCGQWIVEKFQGYGMDVTEQRATLKGFDGTPLQSNNIIARYQPEKEQRILLCAHWDSRPWADNDPDEANHTKPVMAANDGASGVGVMLEIARLLQADTCLLPVGIDFVCFDAEDWGSHDDNDSWALGAQYWSKQFKSQTSNLKPQTYRYGILLDMVGGQGARFYQEGYSKYYANHVVKRVWKAAAIAGFSSYFPQEDGGGITDDHVPVNEVAKIPCIDIINYYPDCEESSFGPTWHTVIDDMDHLDRNTLKAVGQTLIQVLYTEKD
ncbi:M28 family peptidase [Prevotella communis]|uniref:M28 family peptidase n=1 Tax=Prevotella communis TaxID=2913614 RepID=UPI001EDA5467|nr:M28 family peptidase [Prevotella communis]UKK67253.1 M28 family peptidase [Prevotella communis]UKK70607.1 M28 family peptidase [Prevotella communis]